jgi:hypothetical protein|tara:strand:+ start:206 stop:826 length:621 start_codon:yes stop_codon:yes gene_type:complete
MAIERTFPLEQYNQEGLEAIASAPRPIPGQSLTSNPDEPKPFEGPPEFVEFREALDYTVANLLEPNVIEPIITAISTGTPVMDISTQIVYVGFQEGKWNPDLMMMLIEPLTYVLMAICEQSGIEFTIYRGEEDDELNEEDTQTEYLQNLAKLSKKKIGPISKVPQGALPTEIVERIEDVEIKTPSLLDRPAPEETPQQEPTSLLAR